MNEIKIGVALTKCYFCGDDSDILMNTRLTKSMAEKVESMHGKVINKEPCSKCVETMNEGVIFISVKDDYDGDGEPYRTGRMVGIKTEAVKKMPIGDSFKEMALKYKYMFIVDEEFDKLFSEALKS